MDYIADQITSRLVEVIKKKVGAKSNVNVKPFQASKPLPCFWRRVMFAGEEPHVGVREFAHRKSDVRLADKGDHDASGIIISSTL